MRFARYQRGQRLRGVDASFKELKDSRLCEDTFTIDEVEDMLDGLLVVIRGEVRKSRNFILYSIYQIWNPVTKCFISDGI